MRRSRLTGRLLPVLLTVLIAGIVPVFPVSPVVADAQQLPVSDNATSSPVVLCMDLVPLRGPYLTGMTSDSVVVNAVTGETMSLELQWATDEFYNACGTYESTVSHTPATVFDFNLDGLEPDTVYHYRLKSGCLSTADYSFRTFPASGPFTFIVYGDTQDQLPQFSQYERYKLVADAVAAEPDIAFVLHCGDLVNDGDDTENWDRYFDVSRELMATTTVYPCLGNHEKNSANYFDAFGVTPDYSFDCSDAHFTILDSMNTTTAQRTWLDDDLDTDKPWKFVSFHYPMYTSDPNHFGGWLNLQEEWEPLLLEHGVDAVWNGHIHVYEHYLESGIHYTVMGTGGGPVDMLSAEKPDGYLNSLENCMAYAKVTIDSADSATVQIIHVADISADGTEVTTVYPPGTIYDTFTMEPPEQPVWDLNGDHVCNISDVVVLGLHWGETGTPGWMPFDLNNDGVISIGDVVVLGLHWDESW